MLVSDVFRTIANIPIDMSVADVRGHLSGGLLTIISTDTLNPMFTDLIISFGDHPGGMDNSGCSQDVTLEGYQTILRSDVSKFIITLCIPAWSYPPIGAIVNPPADRVGQNGFGCDGLGNRDSDLMMVPGSVLLHEMMHMGELFSGTVRNRDAKINTISAETHVHFIADYAGDLVHNWEGYGPYYAHQLVDIPDGAYSNALNNADNYVWYALSKFWSVQCQRQFGESIDAKKAVRLRGTSWNPFIVQPASPVLPATPPMKLGVLNDTRANRSSRSFTA